MASTRALPQDEGLDVRCCVVSHIKLWPRTNTSDASQLHKVRVHPLLPLPKSRLLTQPSAALPDPTVQDS
jgi:hypothetical protein